MPAHDWTITVGRRESRNRVTATCAGCGGRAAIRVAMSRAAAREWNPPWSHFDRLDVTARNAGLLVTWIGVAHASEALASMLPCPPDFETYLVPVVFAATQAAVRETARDLTAIGFPEHSAEWDWDMRPTMLPRECRPALQEALV